MEIYITSLAPAQKETLPSWLEILRVCKLETNFFPYIACKTPTQILHLITIKFTNCNIHYNPCDQWPKTIKIWSRVTWLSKGVKRESDTAERKWKERWGLHILIGEGSLQGKLKGKVGLAFTCRRRQLAGEVEGKDGACID